MKKLVCFLFCLMSFNVFSCPNGYNEFPDLMYMGNFHKINFPIFLYLNKSFDFPVFEDTMVLFGNGGNGTVSVVSKNGPQDHEQQFIAYKLRPIVETEYSAIETENFRIDFNYYDKNYEDFKIDTQGSISFCYQAKSPIEYR